MNAVQEQEPESLAKVVSPAAASPRAFKTMAYTDVIGGNVLGTEYACELLTVDPISDLEDLEDDCLIVMKFSERGAPFMQRFYKTNRDTNGRFVRPGDERRAYYTNYG